MISEAWSTDEARLVASQLHLPHGWYIRSTAGSGKVVVTAMAASGSDPLPCGHRSVSATARTLSLAVARLTYTLWIHSAELFDA